MTTTMQTEDLRTRFEIVSDDVIATISACSEDDWRRITASEGWSVAVVAHHIAAVNGDFAHIVGKLAAGEQFTPAVSMDEVDAYNARHAAEFASVGKQETLDLLCSNGAAISDMLQTLSDDRLDQVAGVFGGHEMTINQVIEWIVIGHSADHLRSITATLDQL